MKRNMDRLSQQRHDLVVVGGGIYGACVAWEAVRHGLSVSLVEQHDFGHATSANSQKIIHGGFRYLQQLDVKRMRESIRERRHLMRIAPHLVHPLPFLVPTSRRGIQRRLVMRVALALYDLVAWDRNLGVRDPSKRIPNGRLVMREACLRLAPGIDAHGVTGGAVWYDAQVYNSERLTLAFLHSAAEQGAGVANYVQVTGLLKEANRVTGVTAVDRLTGRTLEVRGRLVINTSGPWVNRLVGTPQGARSGWRVSFTKTINVVTKSLTNNHSVSVTLPHREGDAGHESGCCRRVHITPWRGRSIVGSLHVAADDHSEAAQATESEIARLLADVNTAYPGASLTPEDVSFVHVGLLPREEARPGRRVSPDRLSDHYEIRDHGAVDGMEGLLSVVGVKYTTARDVAAKVVRLALKKLGRAPVRSRGGQAVLHGGRIERFDAFLEQALRTRPCGLADDILRQLAFSYGSEYPRVLEFVERDPALGARVDTRSPVIKAQVLYAVREELAWTLRDVVFRRTELGSLEHPGAAALRACAEIMAAELGWDAARVEREIEETEHVFVSMGVLPGGYARREAEVAGG